MNCGSKDHQSNNPSCPEYKKYVEFLVKRRNDYLASAQGGDSESTVKAKKAEVLLAKSKYEKQLHELNELKNQGGRSRSAHSLMTCTHSSSVSSPPSSFVYESPYDLNDMARLNIDCSLHNKGECEFAVAVSEDFCKSTKEAPVALMARVNFESDESSDDQEILEEENPDPIAFKSASGEHEV